MISDDDIKYIKNKYLYQTFYLTYFSIPYGSDAYDIVCNKDFIETNNNHNKYVIINIDDIIIKSNSVCMYSVIIDSPIKSLIDKKVYFDYDDLHIQKQKNTGKKNILGHLITNINYPNISGHYTISELFLCNDNDDLPTYDIGYIKRMY